MPGLNQSRLKLILTNPKAYRDYESREQEWTDPLIIGTIVDRMVLEKSVFNDFIKMTGEYPSDTIKLVIDHAYETCKSSGIEVDDQAIISSCAAVGYGQSWKEETRLKKVKESGQNYLDFLSKAEGKVVVSPEAWETAVRCADSIESHESYYHLFDGDSSNNHFVHSFELGGYECKMEVDRLVIDDKNKVIREIDIKTHGGPLSTFFYKGFIGNKYYFQRTFYRAGLLDWMSKGGYEDYTLEHYFFTVSTTNFQSAPFKVDDSEYLDWNGFTLKSGRFCESVGQAFSRLNFHENEKVWDYPMEYYTAGNMFKLSLFDR